ncbi:MAG: clostripain-related cysteine peptidase [Cyanobacteriota bacterium]
MKRRKLLQYSALGSASFLGNLILLNQKQTDIIATSMSNKRVYEWIFLYWMPYDNNLSRFGTPIIDMLTKGVKSDNILLAVQSDFIGAKRTSRNIITQGNFSTQNLNTANSGSEEVFAEYLNWANLQFQAKKWAIVFLGHGGCLDEISPDEHPEPGLDSKTKWMNIQKLSGIVKKFNQQVGDRVELVFFQNCNKGTIEANYTFRDTAKYTLSSQLLLGAPNYYYEQLFKFLGRKPEINGGQLAEKIMEFEPRDMYHSYTAINNRAITQLSAKMNPLIDAVLAANIKSINLSNLTTYKYMGERFVDVVSFFQTITNQSGANQNKYNEFLDFLNSSIIYKVKQNGTLLGSPPKYENFSGLGIFFPKSKQELEKYRYLEVFSDLKLLKLFDAILVS